MSSECCEIVKAIIIGDSGVGKSSLITSFFHGNLNNVNSTVGTDVYTKRYVIDEHPVVAQLWDTAGLERFQSVVKPFYRYARGIILVYDITDRESFDHVDRWYNDGKDTIAPHHVAMLVGNKRDLTDKRQVSISEGLEFARKRGFLFIETSAKNGINVQSAFDTLVMHTHRRTTDVESASVDEIKSFVNDHLVLPASKPIFNLSESDEKVSKTCTCLII